MHGIESKACNCMCSIESRTSAGLPPPRPVADQDPAFIAEYASMAAFLEHWTGVTGAWTLALLIVPDSDL